MKKKLIIVCILTSLMFTACSADSNNTEAQEQIEIDDSVFDNELSAKDTSTEPMDITTINLDEFDGDVLEITKIGDYELTGLNYSGSIHIDVADDEFVHLYLNGVRIQSYDGPAILVESCSKLIITIVDGTENTILDSTFYDNHPDYDACIFSTCDMSINGNGTLNVFGYYNDAIHVTDKLKIVNGNVNVQATGIGIKGTDGVLINDGTISVQSEKSAVKSRKGYVSVQGGIISIIAGGNAIDAHTGISIHNSEVAVNCVKEKFSCKKQIDIDEDCIK